MFTRIKHVVWAFLALSCASGPSIVAAQETSYHFTSGVSNPAPIPGKPFTITWTGGDLSGTVYIILNYLFPDTPNQDIPYIKTDILSNAPNNGSWVYNVPGNIQQGRYTFSIGVNPILLSDSTPVFTILPSQTFSVAPGPPASSNTATSTYNGCGLPPLPDYTYTGYQPPCTTTINGQVETIYPNVPASDSSSLFSTVPSASATATIVTSTSSTNNFSAYSPPYNTAFASGVFAQALQCPSSIIPTPTSIVVGGTTTSFSQVDCVTVTGSANSTGRVCPSSGYTTFSISGTTSGCCPIGWATTPLDTDLFCFTSIGTNERRLLFGERQISTGTYGTGPTASVEIYGLAFTSVGVVKKEASLNGSSSSQTTSSSAGGGTINSGGWLTQVVMAVAGLACYLF